MLERVCEIVKQQTQTLLPETDYHKGVVNGRIIMACGGNKAIIASANQEGCSGDYWQGMLDGIYAEAAYQKGLIVS